MGAARDEAEGKGAVANMRSASGKEAGNHAYQSAHELAAADGTVAGGAAAAMDDGADTDGAEEATPLKFTSIPGSAEAWPVAREAFFTC